MLPTVAAALNVNGAYARHGGIAASGTRPAIAPHEFHGASGDLTTGIVENIMHRVSGCGTCAEASKAIGNTSSWLTPADLSGRLIVGQGWMCYATGNVSGEFTAATSYIFDGAMGCS
eukprot:4202892-Amphidinium_carterae.1